MINNSDARKTNQAINLILFITNIYPNRNYCKLIAIYLFFHAENGSSCLLWYKHWIEYDINALYPDFEPLSEVRITSLCEISIVKSNCKMKVSELKLVISMLKIVGVN